MNFFSPLILINEADRKIKLCVPASKEEVVLEKFLFN